MKKQYWYILAAFSLIVLTIVGFIIYKPLKNKDVVTPNIEIEKVNNLPAKIIETEAQKASDKINFDKAQDESNASLCALIKNQDSQEFCVKELALRTNKIEDCGAIKSENIKENCVLQISLNLALSSGDLAECEKIEDGMLKKTCIDNLANKKNPADCAVINSSNLKDSCLSITYYNQAKSENKAEICNEIPELVRRANCLSEIKKTDLHSDLDKDGFDFLQEITSGTNPDKQDTDGDGYPDGYEVNQGFNPDGQGSLNQNIPSYENFCKGISDSNLKNTCLLEFQGKPLDLVKCSDIKESALYEYCQKTLLQK